MLYIDGKINNTSVTIFVDTGAQNTVISENFAQRANLMQITDHRYSSKVYGVGTQDSVGKIFRLQLEIKGKFFVLSATVLKNFGHDMLLGLDMMTRHHCLIDLK